MDQKTIFRTVMELIKDGDSDRLREFFVTNKDAVSMTTPFGSWLHIAASKGHLNIVRMLVEDFGMRKNLEGNASKGSPIHSAALEGQYDVVLYLLNIGATLDTSTPDRNPLFGAILGGNVAIARLLIERGIDKSVRYSGASMKDMNALDFAMERGASEFADVLAQEQ